MKHTLTINNASCECDVISVTSLADAIREGCGFTGTNLGCDTAQCGACTVLVDGTAVKSCNVLALQIASSQHVTTIEALTTSGHLHPMQVAFSQHHGLQCGYCTPGMILRGIAMCEEGVPASETAVRQALSGNICRCTGYSGIVKAICAGLAAMRKAPRGKQI